MNDVMQKFKQLSSEANAILNRTFDCRKAEPIYIEILNLIKANPDYRSQFTKAFLVILSTGNAPWELIQFCMRELQWPEVRDAVLAEMRSELEGHHDWRIIAVLNHILEVYEEEWRDSDLYKYYSGESDK